MPVSGAHVAATGDSGASPAHLPAETARPTSLTAHPAPRRGSTVWVALVGGVAVGALAAVLAFKVRSGDASARAAAMAPQAAATAAAPPVAAGAQSQLPTGEWRNADTRAKSAEDHGAPTPPPADAPGGAAPRNGAPAGHTAASPGSGKSALVAAKGPARATEAPETEPAPPAPTPPPAPASAAAETPSKPDSLEAMMKRAVRAESSKAGPPPAIDTAAAAPAAAAPAANLNLPIKPAMGAVMGAVGSVMPAARYCLGPDDPVSRATITFKSDGSVENVAIAGDAAGHPAEACIRARLLEAKVPPFSSPRFTWTVPVRPAN